MFLVLAPSRGFSMANLKVSFTLTPDRPLWPCCRDNENDNFNKKFAITSRCVARNLLRGTKEEVYGMEVPQQGPGAELPWVLRRSSQKPETNANFQL